MPHLLIRNLRSRSISRFAETRHARRASLILTFEDLGLNTDAEMTDALARRPELVAACRQWIGAGGHLAIALHPGDHCEPCHRSILREIFPGVRIIPPRG